MLRTIGLISLAILSAACCFASTKTLRGTLVDEAGAPITDGFVAYRYAARKMSEPYQFIRTDEQGKFALTIENAIYYLMFSAPGKRFKRYFVEFMILDEEAEIKVVLPRYDAPTEGPFFLSLAADDYSRDKFIPFVQKEGSWVVEHETDQPFENYMINVDHKYWVTGPGTPLIGTEHGIVETRAQAQDGKIRVIVSSDHFDFKPNNVDPHILNIKGAGYFVWRESFFDLRSGYQKVKDKRAKEDFTFEGLEDYYQQVLSLLAKVKDPDHHLVSEYTLHRRLNDFIDNHNVEDAIYERIGKDPGFLRFFRGHSILHLVMKQRNPHLRGTSGIKEKGDYWKEPLLALLAMEWPECVRVELLGEGLKFAKEYNDAPLISELSKEILAKYPDSYEAERIRNHSGQEALIGNLAPEFTLPDQDGNLVRLKDYRGKYLLLELWASWCGGCLEWVSSLREAYEKVDKDKIEFLGINLDLTGEKLARAIEKYNIPWKNVHQLGNYQAPIAKQYKIAAVPHFVLIDPQGKVTDFDPYGYEDKALTEALMKIVEGQKSPP